MFEIPYVVNVLSRTWNKSQGRGERGSRVYGKCRERASRDTQEGSLRKSVVTCEQVGSSSIEKMGNRESLLCILFVDAEIMYAYVYMNLYSTLYLNFSFTITLLLYFN